MQSARTLNLAIAILVLVWIGLLLGVSFLATPVKFLAPSLTLSVALDVGRQTFAVFNALELALALGLLTVCLARGFFFHQRGWILYGGIAIFLLVLLQTLWLLPTLDARVEIIIQGSSPPPSMLHNLYIAVDLLKLAVLVAMAVLSFRYLRRAGYDGTHPDNR